MSNTYPPHWRNSWSEIHQSPEIFSYTRELLQEYSFRASEIVEKVDHVEHIIRVDDPHKMEEVIHELSELEFVLLIKCYFLNNAASIRTSPEVIKEIADYNALLDEMMKREFETWIEVREILRYIQDLARKDS